MLFLCEANDNLQGGDLSRSISNIFKDAAMGKFIRIVSVLILFLGVIDLRPAYGSVTSSLCDCSDPDFKFDVFQKAWLCRQCSNRILLCSCSGNKGNNSPVKCSKCDGWDLTDAQENFAEDVTLLEEKRKQLREERIQWERERRRLELERRRLERERRRLERLLQNAEKISRRLQERQQKLEENEKKLEEREKSLESWYQKLVDWEKQLEEKEKRLKDKEKRLKEKEKQSEGIKLPPTEDPPPLPPPSEHGFCCYVEYFKDAVWRWWRDNAIFDFFALLGRLFTDQSDDIDNPADLTAKDTVIKVVYAIIADADDKKSAKIRKDLVKPGVIKESDLKSAFWLKWLCLDNFLEYGNTIYCDGKYAAVPRRWYLFEYLAPEKHSPNGVVTLEKIGGSWIATSGWSSEAEKKIDYSKVTYYPEPNDGDSLAAEAAANYFIGRVKKNDWKNAYRVCMKNSPLRNSSKDKIKKMLCHSGARVSTYSAAPWSDMRIVPVSKRSGSKSGELFCRIVLEKRCGEWLVSKIIE